VLVVAEDGGVLGVVTVQAVAGSNCQFSVEAIAESPAKMPVLKDDQLSILRGVPRPFLKLPVTAFPLPPGGKTAHGLTPEWFETVLEAVLPRSAEAATRSGAAAAPPYPQTPAPSHAVQDAAPPEAREKELLQWLPPALAGLLEPHVRADLWEDVVAHAFRALGCEVEQLGKLREGEAVPDCIVRHKRPEGAITTVIEFVVDAKAGRWTAAVDDLRAMRDYVERFHGNPLFVANALPADVTEKLSENPIAGKTPRAVTGRQLAELIVRRLTDPSFDAHTAMTQLAK
jgi:hypothetical protein